MQTSNARHVAANLLGMVLVEGQYLEEACAQDKAYAALSMRDRGFAYLLAISVIRHLGVIDALLGKLLNNPVKPGQEYVMNALRLGVVQLLWLGTPPHAAVHDTVEIVAQSKLAGLKGLTNAILNRVVREGKDLLPTIDTEKAALPAWLWKRWCKAYGEDTARAVVKAQMVQPPLDISVKQGAAAWAEKLGGMVVAGDTVRITEHGDVTALEGFADGAWWVQDAAASLPVKMLGDIKGKKIIDLCAAPGGKTAQIATLGADVVAVDQATQRVKLLEQNQARLVLNMEIIKADVTRWKPEFAAEGVLLDAPCSATGTVRKHPEIPILRCEKDILDLSGLQRRLLNQVAGWLPKAVPLVYCVCSLEPEEGEGQVEAFLAAHSDFARMPLAPGEAGIDAAWITEKGDLRTLPSHLAESGGMDGFYAARLVRV